MANHANGMASRRSHRLRKRSTRPLQAAAAVATTPHATGETTKAPSNSGAKQRRTSKGRPDAETRAVMYLAKCDPAIQGNKGSNQTLKIACKVGPGFDLPPDVALRLVRDHYNPRPAYRPGLRTCYSARSTKPTRLRPRRGWLLNATRNGTAAPPANGRGDRTPATPPGNGRMTATTPPPSVPMEDSQGGKSDLPVNEAADDPHRLARAVLSAYSHKEGRTLVWYRESFYAWDGSAYRPDPNFSNSMTALIKAEADRQNREAMQDYREQAEVNALTPSNGRPIAPPKAIKVTRRLVADVAQAWLL